MIQDALNRKIGCHGACELTQHVRQLAIGCHEGHSLPLFGLRVGVPSAAVVRIVPGRRRGHNASGRTAGVGRERHGGWRGVPCCPAPRDRFGAIRDRRGRVRPVTAGPDAARIERWVALAPWPSVARATIKIGLALAAAAAVTASIVAALTVSTQPGPTIPLLNLPVPKFSLQGLSPSQAAVSSTVLRQGGPTVVNFWGSWCPPCVEEMPALQEVHHELGEQGALRGYRRRGHPRRSPAASSITSASPIRADSTATVPWERRSSLRGHRPPISSHTGKCSTSTRAG